MRLTDLDPKWLNEERTVFAFRCPHCKATLLTCKSVPMSTRDQCRLFAAALPSNDGDVVPTKQDVAWKVVGEDFATMTVTPSLDASASGHWHGSITSGEC